MSPQNTIMNQIHSSISVKNGLKKLQSVLEEIQNQEFNHTNKTKTKKVQGTTNLRTMFSSTHNPICVIRTLLFAEGKSMAFSNEETLSSSFLIVNGFMTLSLFDSMVEGKSSLCDAKERWLKRLETSIYVGKVSYEYRSEDEDSAGDDARDDIDTTSVIYAHDAEVLSQTLKRVPYVLDETKCSSKLADAKLKLPLGHQQFANALQAHEFHLAVEIYEDILHKDKNRYGKDDLVCAIDYHNLGIACHMCGTLDRALSYLQKSVLLKRACVGHDDPIIADSLNEIGIIFYNDSQFESALAVFLEALSIYKDNRDNEGAGRIFNNIGCVYYQMNDRESSLKYLRFAADSQHMVLGTSETAEASLLSCALCHANVGRLKNDLGHLDATAILEESLLVMESILGDEALTVQNVRATVASMQ